MTLFEPQFLTVGSGTEARKIAVLHRPGAAPGIVWLGGFKSDMIGTKAETVDQWAAASGHMCTRLDYSGHGASDGAFADGTISRWLEESVAVFETVATGPQIVVGSSMGGWLALLLARAHLARHGKAESRLAGLVLIAPAADFTERLMWDVFSEAQKAEVIETGRIERPSDYSDEPDVITRRLIEDGRDHLLLDGPIETGCPVHILQGMRDEDVPWRHAQEVLDRMAGDDVVMTLVKDGDHRLSRPQDLDLLIRAIAAMATGDDPA